MLSVEVVMAVISFIYIKQNVLFFLIYLIKCEDLTLFCLTKPTCSDYVNIQN